MEIRESIQLMDNEQIEARKAEIKEQIKDDSIANDVIESLSAELDELEARTAELVEQAETRAKTEELVNNNVDVTVVEEITKVEEKRNMITRESQEYRDAFFANLVGKATAEQRSIFADNTTYGDGIALPVATDTAIWDQVLTAHPILSDVNIIKSGVVMKVSQMTPNNLTSAGKGKKDSDPIVQLTFTTNEKVLAGKDYITYVTLSYAESKMSAGAMEAFLVSEIANVLGEQLAADVFASIKADAPATSKGSSYFADIHTALGNATQATNAVIYAKASDYYGILAEVDSNGQPIVREGVVLGAQLKLDNAAADVTVVDPKQFVLNVIADTKITSQEVVAKGGYDIGGYLRAEGCLRKTAAASVIA